MVFTRKFSEFPPGTLDTAVGLEAGVNTKGPAGSGGGGGGAVTQTFPQTVPPLAVGNWVRASPITGIYTLARADNAQDGEVIGIVISANAATFTIQQSGYITSAQNVVAGLIPGDVQFLDTATFGAMVPVDAIVNGEISRPVFVPDTPTSGWVVPYRGLIVGGAAPSGGGGGGGGTDTSIVTINQPGHPFIPGDVVRVDTAAVGGPIQYAYACADTFQHSLVAGVVCLVPPPTANQFTLQFSGYNVGSITLDSAFNPVVAQTLYYLSPNPITAGKVTTVNPSLPGQISKPVYLTEQGTANLGVNAGYILPQRSLDLSAVDPSSHTVVQANAFNIGQVVYIQADNNYALAQANTLASSQVAGIVIAANPAQFTVQQSGWITGAIDGTYVDAGFASGDVLYLSPINAGNLTNIVPSAVGQFTKPVYVQESLATRTGEILPQRPLPISSAATNDVSITTVIQNLHGFNVGDWLYISADNTYAKAIATALNTSQAVGVVIQVIDPNTFRIQQSGFITGVVTQNDVGGPIVSSNVYYLSTSVAGRLRSSSPAGVGQYTKPLYIQHAVAANEGVILEQRPLIVSAPSGNDNIQIVTQNLHGFVPGDWLYISANNTYAKGIATALNTSQVVGVVIDVPDPNTFVIQQSGFLSGIVTQDDAAAPIVSANVYYLSTTVAGRLNSTATTTPGQYTKPLYTQHALAGNEGVILEQRPLAIGGGGGIGLVSGVVSATNNTANLIIPFNATIPGLSVTLTPPSITASVLIFVSVDGGGFYTQLQRNGVTILAAGNTITLAMVSSLGIAASQYLDVPGVTTPVTYSLLSGITGGFQLNIRGISSISAIVFDT